MNLAETILHCKKEQKKTWQQIADESGVKKFTVIKITNTNSARFSTAQKLASYFGFSLDDITFTER